MMKSWRRWVAVSAVALAGAGAVGCGAGDGLEAQPDVSGPTREAAAALGHGNADAIDQAGDTPDSETSQGKEAIRLSDDPYDTVDGEAYSPERDGTAAIIGVLVHIDDEGIARVHGFTSRQAYDGFMPAWRSELADRDSSRAPRHARLQLFEDHYFNLCEHHWPGSWPSYTGSCFTADGGWYDADLTNNPVTQDPWNSWNDRISSAMVPPRTHVTLYEHIWYQGNWYDFANTSWNYYWYNVDGWFNDQASSYVSGNY
jgi:hypothetical protein